MQSRKDSCRNVCERRVADQRPSVHARCANPAKPFPLLLLLSLRSMTATDLPARINSSRGHHGGGGALCVSPGLFGSSAPKGMWRQRLGWECSHGSLALGPIFTTITTTHTIPPSPASSIPSRSVCELPNTITTDFERKVSNKYFYQNVCIFQKR